MRPAWTRPARRRASRSARTCSPRSWAGTAAVQPSLWISFVTLRSQSWHHGNVVLLGDAAHTAHFTIGSGTKLAMEDAIALAEALERHPADLEAALTDYELERQPVVERFQEAARDSAAYFENVRRYDGFDPIQFAFNLLTRSGRITHLELTSATPSFVATVDRLVRRAGRRRWWPRRRCSPRSGRGRLTLANRVALAAGGRGRRRRGPAGRRGRRARWSRRPQRGPALVLTELVAVAPDGRVTPGSPGAVPTTTPDAWAGGRAGAAPRRAGAGGLRLGHAGRRGATRPRATGSTGRSRRRLAAAGRLGHPVHAAVPGPQAMDAGRHGPGRATQFAAAASRAAAPGFDLLLLDMAHGYLLAGFLSPLTNRREDEYGGSLEARLRFPLRVFDAVRAAWPGGPAAGGGPAVTDWAPGRPRADEAVAAARTLARPAATSST